MITFAMIQSYKNIVFLLVAVVGNFFSKERVCGMPLWTCCGLSVMQISNLVHALAHLE